MKEMSESMAKGIVVGGIFEALLEVSMRTEKARKHGRKIKMEELKRVTLGADKSAYGTYLKDLIETVSPHLNLTLSRDFKLNLDRIRESTLALYKPADLNSPITKVMDAAVAGFLRTVPVVVEPTYKAEAVTGGPTVGVVPLHTKETYRELNIDPDTPFETVAAKMDEGCAAMEAHGFRVIRHKIDTTLNTPPIGLITIPTNSPRNRPVLLFGRNMCRRWSPRQSRHSRHPHRKSRFQSIEEKMQPFEKVCEPAIDELEPDDDD